MTGVRAHTPLIQQFLDIKAKHPDSILFFRVGDFYEMFFDDAREGSRLLGVTLTSRNNGSSDVPLAGIPVKAMGEYLPRLVREGRRVAICEQVEEASEAEGLVRREVVEIVTPGATLEDSLLAANRNNFIAAIAECGETDGEPRIAVATADLSTGEFEVRECPAEVLPDELARLEPAEILLSADGAPPPPGPWIVTLREPWKFEPELAAESLSRHFEVRGTEGFGLAAPRDGHLIGAAGALVAYLTEVQPVGVSHLRPPRVQRAGRVLYLDEMTRRNLELVEPLRASEGRTLLSVLDRTLTPMGGRKIRRWVLEPLLDLEEIRRRHDAVQALVEGRELRTKVRERLRDVGDLERLATKVSAARVKPRELLALARSLAALPALTEALEVDDGDCVRSLVGELDPMADVREAVETTIDPEAPATVSAGGVLRAGYSAELDALRQLREGAVDWIARLQSSERERTGIETLKIGFNKVFGYFIEVTRSRLDQVPEEYIRKQTLTGAERYVTPELKEWERKVVGAEEKISELEARLFREFRERLADQVGRLQEVAARVATLDVVSGLAEVAVRCDYVRPEVTEEYDLDIRAGRHPVVERTIAREEFIPNDISLDRDLFLMVLTGPNMAGKSTVLRQVGLIALMAQIGSFVPANRARIGLCDRIFTRVGASDSLASGQSTFMVEMTETATILNGATERSLLLLDEIGRGTSTYDGVAIAWAVTEFVHDHLRARTVFATHYHELVELADKLSGVGAFNVTVRETAHDIVFLRRLEPGGCDRSYGVHVARLAGLPEEVTDRARHILHELEGGAAGSRLAYLLPGAGQLSLFESPPSPVLEELAALDPEAITPLEALNELAHLKRMAEDS